MATYTPTGPYNSFFGRGRKLKPPRQRPATLIPAPSRPPTGYYDPSIDAQVAAGNRGLIDLRIDTDTAHRRGSEDLGSSLLALDTSYDRTQQDYDTATGNLRLGYQNLARGQAEAGRVRGLVSEGLAARAASIRDANQGRSQTLLDRDRDRTFSDIATQRGLTQRAFDRQYGAGGDIDLGLARAEREQPLLEADANQLRLGQATAAGYVPPVAHWQYGKLPSAPRKPKPRKGGVGRG